MKVIGIGVVASVAAALACGGGSGRSGGCSATSGCGDGQVCVVSGGVGTCQVPPFGIQLVAPAQGTEVGAAGVDVRATVTKADAVGPAPSSVALVVDGTAAAPMALESDNGLTLTYHATYAPAANVVRSVVLAAVAQTAAGAIASHGAIVSVDTKPPVIASAVATCAPATTCLRDGTLGVTTSVSDDHPVTVTVSLDLPGPSVPAAPTGAGAFYSAELDLAQHALAAFSGPATATVVARDSFGNTATATANAVEVTRLRWVYDAGALGVSSPAVRQDGTLVVAANASSSQLRAVNRGDGTEAWRQTLGTQGIVSAPSIGALVYAGSSDGKLYARDPATGGVAVTCPTPAPAAGALFTPAILTSPETALTAGAASSLYGAKPGTPATCTSAVSTTDPVSTSGVIAGGRIFLATAQARSTLRRFPPTGPEDVSKATTCGAIAAPLAIDSGGNILAACNSGEVISADAATLSATTRTTFSSPALESPVLFPNGDILVGTNDRKLHRLAPPSSGTGTWIDAWNPVPDLGAAVTGAAIVSPDPSGVVAYAVTSLGNLYAVDATGRTVWSTATEVTPPLGAVALSFPAVAPAASTSALPTLYTGSADGKLYAVVVDSGLDPTSPWPKSHHDLRNTGNASAPLP